MQTLLRPLLECESLEPEPRAAVGADEVIGRDSHQHEPAGTSESKL